jgi:hypothetical protein
MFESMGMDVSHVLIGDMRSRISQYIELKLNHHRQNQSIYDRIKILNESLAQDEEIVHTIFASDIRAEWVPWKHQTHQVQA